MLPFINLMINRAVTLAFNGWKRVAVGAVHLRTKVAARIANGLLAKVFLAWAQFAGQSRNKPALGSVQPAQPRLAAHVLL